MKIAVVFDFDETLAHDSTSGFLDDLGYDAESFWRDRVAPLLDNDWDPIPAYLYQMIAASNDAPPEQRITRDRLRDWGSRIAFFDGVESLFPTLRDTARDVDPRISVEFYLISSGIHDILDAMPIRHEFTDLWACHFEYDPDNDHAIVFPRNVVSFTEKTRFLYKISKGQVGPAARGRPFDVNVRTRDYHIPLKNMIFVGDGQTDVPCFTLVKKYGGVGLGVYDRNAHHVKWGKAFDGLVRQQRVASLYSADYREGSDLHNMLTMTIRHMASDLAAVV